jgi:hypothetical protein
MVKRDCCRRSVASCSAALVLVEAIGSAVACTQRYSRPFSTGRLFSEDNENQPLRTSSDLSQIGSRTSICTQDRRHEYLCRRNRESGEEITDDERMSEFGWMVSAPSKYASASHSSDAGGAKRCRPQPPVTTLESGVWLFNCAGTESSVR